MVRPSTGKMVLHRTRPVRWGPPAPSPFVRFRGTLVRAIIQPWRRVSEARGTDPARPGLTNEEHYVALPKLYGAPAYGRPPRPVVEAVPRPPDPDDLPLEAFRGLDDDDLPGMSDSEARTSSGNGSGNGSHAVPEDGGPNLEPQPFSLRSLSRFITGR